MTSKAQNDSINRTESIMKYSLTKQPISLAVSCALLLGAAAGSASAQIKPSDAGYLTDQRAMVVRSGFNLCWRDGSNPTPDELQPCHP